MLPTTPDNDRAVVPDIWSLIEDAKANPPVPIIQGLLNEGEIAGLHGPQEAFKTIFCLQLAASIASRKRFLGWDIPEPRDVYFFETEMSTTAMGRRLGEMFRGEHPSGNVKFADEKRLKQFKRAADLNAKFALLSQWVSEARADVAFIDTCNPFFRGKQNPNDETAVGAFFDLLEGIPAAAKVFVRHNHKPRLEEASSEGACRIRGSGQFADVPDLLMEIRRTDKRINKAELSITKYRHGTKPDDLTVWFDRGDFRLCAVPPVVHVLRRGPLTREQLLRDLQIRFGIAQRKADDLIESHVRSKDLIESMEGHKRLYAINKKGE
jgi:RecA-family ATPase